MGWQGRDPSTDFRLSSLKLICCPRFCGQTCSVNLCWLLLDIFPVPIEKAGRNPAAWEYPFVVAGVNITFMIMQCLTLKPF
ncbi:unnamed protein product [Prunus armeniaca]|uniref:ELMO domain-containing protein n=1 Tax=Prunus armeniaca TaxID=36596 RepID=A0A6J5X8K9_PRUAR|nr:unnamed protein product [Prunus armeniaca]CAB4308302.1 unnamed protein product [Prunus armeniaca]